MKRILCFLLAILVMLSLCATALAAEADTSQPTGDVSTAEPEDEPTPDSEDEPTPQPEAAVTLTIDSQHAYEGMEKAYKNGYTPTVSGKTAILVLPLTADGALKDDEVTAALNLGETTDSPFVYKNYEKTFKLEEKQIRNSKQKQTIYYIRFDLALTAQRYNGVYPVVVNLTAHDMAGNAIIQSFTTYVTIRNGKDPNAGENEPIISEPSVEKPTSSPVVLVTGYTVKPGTVVAGKDFSVDVTLFNTSRKKSVQNMVVTVSCANSGFTLKNESSTIFVDKLGKEESTTLTLSYETALNTEPGQYAIDLAMRYDDPDAQTLSSSGTINIAVRQTQRVELTMPTISKTVTAGDTIPLSFQVLNLGRSKVYNVRCDVSGFGLLPTSTAFVGDMEPGSEGNADMNLFVGTKDLSEGYTGSDLYGATEGTVILTYEDDAGKEFTQEFSFRITIQEPAVLTKEEEKAPAKPASQWWISVILVAGMLLAVLGGIAFIRWRRSHETV